MTTALDVVSYIRSRMDVLGEVQFQKLAYYAQAWSLAWDGKPLFDEGIEAWKMGPVTKSIRRQWPDPNGSGLSVHEAATVDAVIEFYGRMPGAALGEMTHGELPWAEAWDKRPQGSLKCSVEIDRDTMRKFYARKALVGEDVPSRLTTGVSANDDDILAAARVEADRWPETLLLLSQ